MATTLKPEWIVSEGYYPHIPHEIVLKKYGVITIIKL